MHILQQLRLEGSEPVILLRTLQRELLLLVNLKRQLPIRHCVRCLISIGYGRTAGMMGEALNRLASRSYVRPCNS
ncbi:hypothetical protein ACVXHA_01010 [Escherichia coli]